MQINEKTGFNTWSAFCTQTLQDTQSFQQDSQQPEEHLLHKPR